MGQLSLYRRYRPQTFGEVVGQGHVTRTLQNALAEQRLPHALLFSGPRGTGKTSTARILAKALNCEQAPTREPCNVCTSCREITEGSSLDVVEIDAASHGSVDDARDLREKVAYAPVGGRWKVYILDECHMLTTAANNALLKVLEEPPSHAVFVFATTETSKVLQTVRDRCQRYEFRAIEAPAVAGRLEHVAALEGVTLEGNAAALIAARTTGSVRDALGLLDQAISYSGSHITVEDVGRLFGTVAGDTLFEAVDLISERDAAACFAFTDRLIRSGQEPREFLRALVDHLRAVFLVQHAPAAQEVLDLPDSDLDRLRGQANRLGPADLLRILDLAGEAAIQLREAVDSRLALEIAFARMARPDLHASPAALLARVEGLERQLGVAPVAPRAVAPSPSEKPAVTSVPIGPQSPPESPRPAPMVPTAQPAPASPAPASAAPVAVSPTSAPAPAATAPVAAPPAAPARGTVDLDHIQRAWPSIMQGLRKRKITAQAMMLDAVPVAFEDGELTLEFGPTHAYHRDKVSDPKSGYLSPLVETLFETFGVRPSVRCVLGTSERAPAAAAADFDGPPSRAPASAPAGTPGVASPPPGRPRDAIELIREGFGAEIVEER